MSQLDRELVLLTPVPSHASSKASVNEVEATPLMVSWSTLFANEMTI